MTTQTTSDRDNIEEWISTAEAARILGLTQRRVRQLIDGGELEGRKFADVWQVRRSSVERYKLSRDK